MDLDMLDERYNYDFTNLTTDGKDFKRGSGTYQRLYGWKRIAIKVTGSTEETQVGWEVSKADSGRGALLVSSRSPTTAQGRMLQRKLLLPLIKVVCLG